MVTDISSVFPLVLHRSYFYKGFFNIRVSHDRLVRSAEGSISLTLGESGEVVQAHITRQANKNKTCRVYCGKVLSRWFQSHFRLKEIVYLHLSEQGRWTFTGSSPNSI